MKRRTVDTVEEAERTLIAEEGDLYVEPALRKGGRPVAGSRGHIPSLTMYVKKNCRCPRCLQFYSEWKKERREARKARLKTHPEEFRHGSTSTYGLGCTCDPCKAAGKTKNDNRS